MYIEFHARSAFSFLEGASLPESLIETCANLGMPAMALLDRDGVYGAPRFYMAAKKAEIKAHIGAEVKCVFSPQRFSGKDKDELDHQSLRSHKYRISRTQKIDQEASSMPLSLCGEFRLPL